MKTVLHSKRKSSTGSCQCRHGKSLKIWVKFLGKAVWGGDVFNRDIMLWSLLYEAAISSKRTALYSREQVKSWETPKATPGAMFPLSILKGTLAWRLVTSKLKNYRGN